MFCFAHRWNNNSAYCKGLWEWSRKRSIWHMVSPQQKTLAAVIIYFAVHKNRVDKIDSKEACQLFLRTLSTWFLEQNQAPAQSWELSVFNVSSAWLCEPTSLPAIMGVLEPKWPVQRTGRVQWQGGADPDRVLQVIRTVFVPGFHSELQQLYRRRQNKYLGCHFVILL